MEKNPVVAWQRQKKRLLESIDKTTHSKRALDIRKKKNALKDKDSDEYFQLLEAQSSLTRHLHQEIQEIDRKIHRHVMERQKQNVKRLVDKIMILPKKSKQEVAKALYLPESEAEAFPTARHMIVHQLNKLTKDSERKIQALRTIFPPKPSDFVVLSFQNVSTHKTIKRLIEMYPTYLLGLESDPRLLPRYQYIFQDVEGIQKNLPWFQQQTRYLAGLSPSQRDIVVSYANLDYEWFNDPENQKEPEVMELQRIILASPPLLHDLIVWRGSYDYRRSVSDHVYSFPGFVSTSLLLESPLAFMDTNTCCLTKILLKKKTRCLFLPPVLGKNNQDEMEILLPYKTRLHVSHTDIKILNDGGKVWNEFRQPLRRQLVQTQIVPVPVSWTQKLTSFLRKKQKPSGKRSG